MKPSFDTNNSVQKHFIYDVIIAGAGPVGLFLACELALAHCSVLILEMAATPDSPLKRLPFGMRGLSSPSIADLDRRGLLDELQLHKRLNNPHQNPGQGAQRQVGHFAGIPYYEGDIDSTQWRYRLQDATPTSLLSEMEELESLLTRRAQALRVEFRRGLAITDFRQEEEGVTAQSGEQTFNGKWLVGCDGSRSMVRKLGGFEFAGTEPEFTGYSAQVDIADPEKLSPGRNVTPRGMYLQSQPGYLHLQDFDGGAFHDSKVPITREQIQQVLRRISNTDVSIITLHTATSWTDRSRQVTAYRNGRLLLAGDAAHIHSPLGGQGLNLGLGDAMNLGWKLAATIHNKAPHGLLDSYHTERYPIGAKVLDWSRAQVAIMRPDPHAQALHAIVRDLIKTRDGATYFAARVWGVSTRIDLGDHHPLVGCSAPDFRLDGGRNIAMLLRDGVGLLLDFGMDDALKDAANKYGDRIRYMSAQAKEQCDLRAMLIRPDGIVAWASDNTPNDTEFHTAAANWFLVQPS